MGLPEFTNKDYSLERMMDLFSIDFLPDVYNHPVAYRAYVFATGPELYLFDNGQVRDEIKELDDFYSLLRDPEGEYIGKALSDESTNRFLPFFSQRVRNYPVSNESIKVIEKQGTFYGHTMKYPRFSEDFRRAGSISLDFVDDRYKSINRMISIWIKYIQYVTKTEKLAPREKIIYNRYLDYVGSLVYIVTKMDGKEIVYWEKKYGIFPTETAADSFSYNNKEHIFNDTLSVSFDYSLTSNPYDTNVFADINNKTEHRASLGFQDYSSWENMMFNTSPGPYITVDKSTGKYYLNWVK